MADGPKASFNEARQPLQPGVHCEGAHCDGAHCEDVGARTNRQTGVSSRLLHAGMPSRTAKSIAVPNPRCVTLRRLMHCRVRHPVRHVVRRAPIPVLRRGRNPSKTGRLSDMKPAHTLPRGEMRTGHNREACKGGFRREEDTWKGRKAPREHRRDGRAGPRRGRDHRAHTAMRLSRPPPPRKRRLCAEGRLLLRPFQAKMLFYMLGERIVDFRMPGNRLFLPGGGIELDVAACAMAVQDAPVLH